MAQAARGAPKVSVIVPTYNEADNLPELVERIERALASVEHEVVVVDDNSPDGTADVAEGLNEVYGNVVVVRRPGKLGLGSAVADGFRAAGGDVLVVMDADLQHPPELLPAMLEKIGEGYDLVVASRYARGGSVRGWGVLRRIISLGAVSLARLSLPEARRVKDAVSGYFALRRSVVEGVELAPRGYKVLLEVLVKGRYSSVAEVPYEFARRRRGRSKLGLRGIVDYVRHVLSLSEYRVAKFAAVGASGVLVNEGLLFALVALGLQLPLAGALAIEASILNNFALNDLWTFRDRRSGSPLWRCLKYHAAVAVGALANLAALLALSALGLHYLAANAVGIALGFAANYALSEVAVWAARG